MDHEWGPRGLEKGRAEHFGISSSGKWEEREKGLKGTWLRGKCDRCKFREVNRFRFSFIWHVKKREGENCPKDGRERGGLSPVRRRSESLVGTRPEGKYSL